MSLLHVSMTSKNAKGVLSMKGGLPKLDQPDPLFQPRPHCITSLPHNTVVAAAVVVVATAADADAIVAGSWKCNTWLSPAQWRGGPREFEASLHCTGRACSEIQLGQPQKGGRG